ncbi:MAG: hypothetical protein KAW47_00210 [Thermoplasmatales archaeon]|nr:hypothetical protein [Thermoplasmatales archaeon]
MEIEENHKTFLRKVAEIKREVDTEKIGYNYDVLEEVVDYCVSMSGFPGIKTTVQLEWIRKAADEVGLERDFVMGQLRHWDSFGGACGISFDEEKGIVDVTDVDAAMDSQAEGSCCQN